MIRQPQRLSTAMTWHRIERFVKFSRGTVWKGAVGKVEAATLALLARVEGQGSARCVDGEQDEDPNEDGVRALGGDAIEHGIAG